MRWSPVQLRGSPGSKKGHAYRGEEGKHNRHFFPSPHEGGFYFYATLTVGGGACGWSQQMAHVTRDYAWSSPHTYLQLSLWTTCHPFSWEFYTSLPTVSLPQNECSNSSGPGPAVSRSKCFTVGINQDPSINQSCGV